MSKDFRFTHRKGRYIQVSFAYNPGKWVSTGTHDMQGAIVWALQHLGAGRPNRYTESLTLEAFATPFVENGFQPLKDRDTARGNKCEPTKYAKLASVVKRYIIPAHGHYILKHITANVIENWLISEKGLSNCLRNCIITAYRALLNEAIKADIIEANPAERVPLFRHEAQEKECFTLADLDKLFPTDKNALETIWGGLMWATYFCIMKETGFRPGEVAGLSPSGITETGAVYTEQSINPNTHILQQSIKTTHKGQGYKIGFLSKRTLDLVEELKQTERVKNSGVLFSVPTKSFFITSARANAQLDKAFKISGVEKGRKTLYSFRHTFNTMIFDKIDEKTRLVLMGHTANVKTYDHRTITDRINNISQETVNSLKSIVNGEVV